MTQTQLLSHSTRSKRAHDVRFYATGHFPAKAVADYLAGGVQIGACIVIATAQHRATLARLLGTVTDGRLVMLDAEEVLGHIAPALDEAVFDERVAKPVRELLARFGRVRAFGEMVDVLWRRGETDVALRLEQRWNALIDSLGIELLCAYSVDASKSETLADFTHVCEAHDGFIDDRDVAISGDDFFTDIARLLASALDHEASFERLAAFAVGPRGCADFCFVDLIERPGESYATVAAAHRGGDETLVDKLRRKHRFRSDASCGPARVGVGQVELLADVDDAQVAALASDDVHGAVLKAMRPQSILTAPIVSHKRVSGTVTLVSCHRSFRARDAWMIEQIASAASVALDNAQLFASEARTKTRLVRLHEVTAALSRAKTVVEVAEVACRVGAQACAARASAVWLLGSDGELRLEGSSGQPQAYMEQYARIQAGDDTHIAAVARTGEAVWIDSDAQYAVTSPSVHARAVEARRNMSHCVLPLVSKGVVIGVLGLGRDGYVAYTDDERAFCRSLAQQCAQALDRALSFDAERRSNVRLSLLVRIGESLSHGTAPRVALETLAKSVVPAFADVAVVYLIDGASRELVAALHHDHSRCDVVREVAHAIADTPVDLAKWTAAVRSGELAVPRAQASALENLGVRSWIAAPARAGDTLVAAVILGRDRDDHAFDEADRAFAEEIARRAGASIERSRLFESVRESARRAEAANRLKDEFLATVSHELRTPLSAITGWIKLLRSGTLPLERRNHAIDVIERNARAQEKLVGDLLDVSRVMSGGLRLNVEAASLMAVVSMGVDTVKPTAEVKGVQLVVSSVVDDRDGIVMGDPERLQQVVCNLLANAVKFTPKGGCVSIGLTAEPPNVLLSVTDTGAGIPAEFLAHVFEAFRQAERGSTRSHGGLGLGLTIAHRLVEMHGGTIEARSDGVGTGATFIVKLPTAYRRPDAMPRVPSLAQPHVASRRDLEDVGVLVVEDEPDSRELLLALFDRCGARTYGAASVAEALEKLHRGEPKLIVSDLGLPGEDGLSLIRKVRQSGTLVPAIALTAFARSNDRARALEAGFDAHLAKPVEPDDLVAMAVNLVRAGRSAVIAPR